jgi:nitrate/TMAO reductase-like tetraheme cytochrome c subunit
MTNNENRIGLRHIAACIIIIALAGLLSGYLTFKVQFERKKDPPVRKPKEVSYQIFRVKEQERKQRYDHFHLLTEDINLEAWARRSTCIACHSPYPHGKNLQAIAVMNLHTEFMTCHSCHLKLDVGEQIRFGWIDPTGSQSKAEPYGVRIDPETGAFAETEDHFSKLTPFRKINGEWEPITSLSGIEEALGYMEEQEVYSEEERKAIVDRLHEGAELKEFIQCSRCHSKDGIMDFKSLGFEPARINQLQKMEIGGMLTNYDIFYFPDLYRNKF